jgi:phosphoglycolate phosphatase-like HAD superfamily hydrolase
VSDPDVEEVRPPRRRARRAAVFDFDGTLSLVRGGWMRLMVTLMVAELRRTGTSESDPELTALCADFVMALNGRPTVWQMRRLAEEVEKRGGRGDAAASLARYQERLRALVEVRRAELRRGAAAGAWAVAGGAAFLDALRRRGVALYLASGTEREDVQAEAQLLGLAGFFGPHVYGPEPDGPPFAKADVIARALRGLEGDELVAFGDGVVEIEEAKKVGAVAVAVACDEEGGGLDRWKRERLVAAGADLVIADYRCAGRLLERLFAEG